MAMRCSALLVVAFAILGHARRLHRHDAEDSRESEVSALPSLTSLLTQGPATGFNAGLHAPRVANQRAAAPAMSIADTIDAGKYGVAKADTSAKVAKAVKVSKAAPAVKAKVAAAGAAKAKAAAVAVPAVTAAATAAAPAVKVAPVVKAAAVAAPVFAAASAVESSGAQDALAAIAPVSAGILGLSAAALFFSASDLVERLYSEEETEFDYVDPKVIGTPEDPIAQFNADRKPGPVGPGNRQAGEIVFGKQGAAFVKPGFRRKRPVSPIRAVEAFGVLELVSSQGLLSKLEKDGVFSKIEPYLPLLDKYNLLSLAERGLQIETEKLTNTGLALLVFTASLIITVPDSDVVMVLLQALVGLVGSAGAVALLGAGSVLSTIQNKKGVRWGTSRVR